MVPAAYQLATLTCIVHTMSIPSQRCSAEIKNAIFSLCRYHLSLLYKLDDYVDTIATFCSAEIKNAIFSLCRYQPNDLLCKKKRFFSLSLYHHNDLFCKKTSNFFHYVDTIITLCSPQKFALQLFICRFFKLGKKSKTSFHQPMPEIASKRMR